MTDLTNNITSGKLQPPSFYNPELSPQLEQIILTALARDRNERYSEASLIAQDLRKLKLEPPTQPIQPVVPILSTSSAQGPQLSRGYSQMPREQATTHPPKRPIQRPSYLKTEIQPRATPFFGFPEQKDNNPSFIPISSQATQKEETHTEGQDPLSNHPDLLSEEGEMVVGERASDRQTQDQHGIWNQLQRLFRPPQR